jgi:hypothetical protein
MMKGALEANPAYPAYPPPPQACAASMASYFACQACTCASREVLTHSARVAWSALFFVAMVVAWIMRDFAKPLLEKIPCR